MSVLDGDSGGAYENGSKFPSHLLVRLLFISLSPFFGLPTTVTPFPLFTILRRAADFCAFIPPGLLVFANLSTLLSSASLAFFFDLFSLFRVARFSFGESSPRARRSAEERSYISSGASILAIVLLVGKVDSKLVDATFVTVEIVAVG